MEDSGIVEQSIKHSISKNGFPGKIVRLPFKPVYHSCKNHGTSLNTVLKNLKEEEIFGEIQGNHIEFRSRQMLNYRTEKTSGDTPPLDFFGIPGTPQGDLMETARQYLQNMSPEQKAEIQKRVNKMSEEEKRNMLQFLSQQFPPKSP